MLKDKELAEYALKRLQQHGLDNASCYIRRCAVTEANYEQGDFSLLRTFETGLIKLKAVTGQRAGEIQITQLNKDAIDTAAAECAAKATSAEEDPYEGISENAMERSFSKGDPEPDTEKMLEYIREKAEREKDKREQANDAIILSHVHKRETYLNTNNVNLYSDLGYYRDGFLYVPDMHNGFSDVGDSKMPYNEAVFEEPRITLEKSFEGTVIFTPRLLRLHWWITFMDFRPDAIPSEKAYKSQLWADKLGQQAAAPCFSLSNMPLDERICNASPFTSEGYLARNINIVENGYIRELPHSGRGARSLGIMPNCDIPSADDPLNTNIVIKPGNESIKKIINGIRRGIITDSVRGGIPCKGEEEFSRPVKNAVLIENGRIAGVFDSVYICANFDRMYKNIRAVSSELLNTGGDSVPWIAFDGVTIQ